MCVLVCVYVRVCECMHVCARVYVCVYVQVCECVHVLENVYPFMCAGM